jgi:hypothetical protein
MTRTCIEPFDGVSKMDAAADLQATWVAAECRTGRLIISRAELDHMPTGELVVSEALRKPRGRVLRDEILLRTRAVIAQTATDDLFHLALVEIDAWAEMSHKNKVSRTLSNGAGAASENSDIQGKTLA